MGIGDESTVVVVDADVDGLGSIVGDLLVTNLEDRSRRSLVIGASWSVALDVFDADSVFVLMLGEGRIRIAKEAVKPAEIVIRISGDHLFEVPDTPLLAGLPDPRSAAGRVLIRRILGGDVGIKGIIHHPLLLRRFLWLLTTA